MAGGIPGLGTLLQYGLANQGLNPLQAAFSDIPGGGASSDVFGGLSSLLGGLALGGPIGGGLGALTSLLPLITSLFGGGRNSTGPGSATSDIASGGGSSSDPVIRLLGEGAGNLPPGVPISSSSGAASGFGSYFDVARKLEDLVRWGPGGLSDPRAEGLDATTLKNAMTELGNPGSDGSLTIQALQNAFNTGSKYLTPDNLNLLTSQFSPQELKIFDTVWGGQDNTGRPPGGIPNNPLNPNNPFNNPTPNTNFNPMQNPLFANANPSTLMSLLGLGGGAPPVNISGDWLGGRIGPPAMMGAL